MSNEPIIVWPPGSLYGSCDWLGNFYDCSYDYPDYQAMGAVICCPSW